MKEKIWNWIITVVRYPLSLWESWKNRPAANGLATDTSGLRLRSHHKIA